MFNLESDVMQEICLRLERLHDVAHNNYSATFECFCSGGCQGCAGCAGTSCGPNYNV